MFALGTVQLGIDYGINNSQGLPSADEVDKILHLAWSGGVRWLDTASAYGLSEERIGNFLLANPTKKFSVVTKLPADVDDVKSARSSLLKSLGRLKLKTVECLMLHNTEHIPRLGTDLGQFLLEENEKGTILEIGSSVYSLDQLAEVAKYPFVSVIQIPANVFDQRFLDDRALAILQRRRVFVRSVYLQGLLLMDQKDAVNRVPLASKNLERWHQTAQDLKTSPEELALGWVRKAFPSATPLVGCENADQLTKNFEIWETSQISDGTFQRLSAMKCDIEDVILPMKWKRD